MVDKINIAIDGYSACGKSTTARAMAAALGYTYIDSGAMYRAVTLHFLDHNVTWTNPKAVTAHLANVSISFKMDGDKPITYLNGVNVEDEIRSMRVTEHVSEVSAISAVREAMVRQQKKLSRKKGVVMEGRDIGSVVLPDAELKIFMTADINIRTERRQQELLEKGQAVNFDVVRDNLISRDEQDSTREDSPLIKAADAIVLDNTFLTLEEVIESGLNMATSVVAGEINRHGSND